MLRIITDTSSDMKPEEFKALDVIPVAMSVAVGERVYVENRDLTTDEFYDMLENTPGMITSAQPAIGEWVELFRELKEQGDEAVVVTISSGLSGTYQTAMVAKEMAEYENCYIVDSLVASGGERILVDLALKRRAEGKSAAEIAEELNQVRKHVSLWVYLDQLKYLFRGGRISHTKAVIGDVARIKPIISYPGDGKIKLSGKALGRKRGIRFMLDQLKKEVPANYDEIYLLYTRDMQIALELTEELKKIGITVKPEKYIQVNASVGSHIGPIACGLTFIRKE